MLESSWQSRPRNAVGDALINHNNVSWAIFQIILLDLVAWTINTQYIYCSFFSVRSYIVAFNVTLCTPFLHFLENILYLQRLERYFHWDLGQWHLICILMTLFSHAALLSFWIIIRFAFLRGVKRLFSYFDKVENHFVCVVTVMIWGSKHKEIIRRMQL